MKKITEQEKRKILFQTPYTVSYDLDTLQRPDSLVALWENILVTLVTGPIISNA
jgi:hypothetical protein